MPSDTNTPTTLPLLVDRREAGRLLCVSPGTIDNLRLAGELPSVKLRGRRLFDVADLRRLVEVRKSVRIAATVATVGHGASADGGGPKGDGA